jgi:archaellum component FlaC
MTVDERIEALVMSVELLTRDVETLRATVQIDAENIRALVHIAEIHERRITDLEDGQSST